MKMKKVADEYKNNVEKYVNFRKDYEQKMTESARVFFNHIDFSICFGEKVSDKN